MSSRGALDIRDTLSSDHQQESVELQPLGEPSSADVVGEPVDDVQKSSPWRLSLDADDSGTEADDERAVLPRPLPLPSPSTRAYGLLSSANDQHISSLHGAGGGATVGHLQPGYWNIPRRTKGRGRKDEGDMTPLELTEEGPCYTSPEVLRRLSENVSMTMIGIITLLGAGVLAACREWRLELATFGITVVLLYVTYPIRAYPLSFVRRNYRELIKFPFSSQFDPAPLIYPVFLPVLIALSISRHSSSVVLPNIILGLCSLPPQTIPCFTEAASWNFVHWMITILPFLPAERSAMFHSYQLPLTLRGQDPERLVLLYPFHQSLSSTLYLLTTSSLLPSELQLLTTTLIIILLYAESPQAQILKAILWVGGSCVLLMCQDVCQWEIMLARIPTWKFTRNSSRDKEKGGFLRNLDRKLCSSLCGSNARQSESSSESEFEARPFQSTLRRPSSSSSSPTSQQDVRPGSSSSAVEADDRRMSLLSQLTETTAFGSFNSMRLRRRSSGTTGGEHAESLPPTAVRRTQGGRRRRVIPANVRSFLTLTADQAQARKWLYAAFVYLILSLIIVIPVRVYISRNAIDGAEPFGWVLGYMLGNISPLRLWLVTSRLDRWVSLPTRPDECIACGNGWIEHLRQDVLGVANCRLIICVYYLSVVAAGLLLVVRLSSIVETDTRRKVFHGMMVAMLLPTTFIDPAFVSFALAGVLSIFLLLELFRAAQLPPISRPLTNFIAPYVDGRDYRGPVVISHIFLLIGCAIPLWLSLASTPLSGSAPWAGWEVQYRDISMVSGVICVGMGDAAASLIGRRFGRRRWFFGGGKSIEGSIAFAVAVFVGLVLARIWLVLGGWDQDLPHGRQAAAILPLSSLSLDINLYIITVIITKAVVAAAGASFTEAVLTGGNDNVVVPLVLWLLVRGLRL